MRSSACAWMIVAMGLAGVGFAGERTEGLAPIVECSARGGMPNVLAKLAAGEAVRIAYIGGSITATQNGWRPKTTDWLRRQYPAAKIEEIDASIGGTGSDLGVFRFGHEVLRHRPHLVFIEFAVNDSFTPPPHIQRRMEGMVRQAWRQDPSIDVCFVYTMKEDMMGVLSKGLMPASATAMEKVAAHYGIPSIFMGSEALQLVAAGKMVIVANPKTDAEREALAGKLIFSGDGVHPHVDTGHRLYAEAVARSFEKMKGIGTPGPRKLGDPLRADHFEKARLVPIASARLSGGWEKLDPATCDFARWYERTQPQIWAARKPGESIAFRFKGRHVGFLDVCTPDSGQVEVVLDDRPAQIVRRFTPYTNGAHITAFTIASDLPDEVHTVKVTVHPGTFDKAAILAIVGNRIDKPERYQGGAWYPGWIMIVGEMVEE